MAEIHHKPNSWKAGNLPAANTQATATQAAAAGTGYCNVVTWLTVMVTAGASAPSAKSMSVAIVNGASGSTDYIWGPQALSIPAVAGAVNGIALANLSIVGKPNTATTIEFSVAGGANTVQSVDMGGLVTSDL